MASESFSPDAGSRVVSDPRAAVCARVDAGGPVPYAVVQQVFNGECISCHDRGADLVLDDNASWGNLVNHAAPADEACGGTLVVPGDPSASYLFQKLSSSSPCSGLQMPRGELGAEPLPVCDQPDLGVDRGGRSAARRGRRLGISRRTRRQGRPRDIRRGGAL